MPFKTYRSLKYTSHSKTVLVGKKVVTVQFINGVNYPSLIGGEYSTSEKSIQDALEKDPSFKKKFILVRTTDDKPAVALVKAGGVMEVTTINQAKDYLLAEFSDITPAEVANKVAILKSAESRNITFPNLQ